MKFFVALVLAFVLMNSLAIAQKNDHILPVINVNYTTAEEFTFLNTLKPTERVINGKKQLDFTRFETIPQTGFDIGLSLTRSMSKKFHFVTSAQINFNRFQIQKVRGIESFELESDKKFGGNYLHSFNLLYFGFPFKIGFDIFKKLRLEAGLHTCFLADAKTTIQENTQTTTSRSLVGMNTFIMNPTAGVEWNISHFISLHLFYEKGIDDVINMNHPLYEYGGKLSYWSFGATLDFKRKDRLKVSSIML